MPISAGHIGFTPDIGLLPFSDHYDSTKNPLLVDVALTDLTVSGAQTDPANKGPQQLYINVGATVYTIPTSIWRRFHPGRSRVLHWKDGAGNSGNFKFFADAPAVF